MKKQKGITLVALVITIVILLILAGISISALTNQGLFAKAQQAKKRTENAQKEEYQILQEYMKEIDGVNAISVAEAQSDDMLTKTINTFVKDAYGNILTVPAGFKIKVDDTTKNATTVDKGIVIIDSDENEFVWIPVGKIYTDEAKTESNEKTIELNRYTFDENGNPTAQNDAVIGDRFQELATATFGNTAAKNIEKFKKSVETNRGYYIGRYEARKNSSEMLTEKGTDNVWNYITQQNAAIAAQNMYQNATTFTSDLMNSYAWDTAIIFEQTFDDRTDKTIPYSRKSSVNIDSLAPTGTTTDKICNIYDMASNVWEWTTETQNQANSIHPCVWRGGGKKSSNEYTSFRYNYGVDWSNSNTGFRPLLYINV